MAQANLEQARWSLARTEVHAASDGYITNLQAGVGSYATARVPLVALVDTTLYVCRGYFRRDQARAHRPANRPRLVALQQGIGYSGEVESMGAPFTIRAWRGSRGLLLDVKPNVPWVLWPSGRRCGSGCWRFPGSGLDRGHDLHHHHGD